MIPSADNSKHDWSALHRDKSSRPVERWVEKGIFLVSMTSIVMVFLIFLFVARESLPIFLQQMSSAPATDRVIAPEEISAVPAEDLRRYLGLSPAEFASKSPETLRLLVEIRQQMAAEAPKDKDAKVNTTEWRYLLGAYQWTGYTQPESIWQPVSKIQKFNIVPLLVGSLKTTLISLLFAVPVALGAAIYVSQLAPVRLREWLKPAIELLAGIPSVVLGFFALIIVASLLQSILGYESRLNAFTAGVALGFAIIPVVFSISEDALTSVPSAYTQAALALGSPRWKAAWQIVLPAAIPGVFAAVVLGFGRAIGETMIVLMASGNASILSWNPFDSARTITATIAAELAETIFGGHHYRILFMLGTLLFAVTFVSNLTADIIIHRLKAKLEGRR